MAILPPPQRFAVLEPGQEESGRFLIAAMPVRRSDRSYGWTLDSLSRACRGLMKQNAGSDSSLSLRERAGVRGAFTTKFPMEEAAPFSTLLHWPVV
ncbi:hypothetical protein NS383_00110 [Pseudomonas oryzihabitans]|nr:hypothetical protein NS383_00110 [Pseudomonas psychrotolerans]